MSYHDWLRFSVIIASLAIALFVVLQVWRWHADKANTFDLREFLMSVGKDGKQHPSRVALGELVALFATTSGYLGTLALKPDSYELATTIYGALWVVRGGFNAYLKSNGDHGKAGKK